MSEEAKLLELHMLQDTVAFGRLHEALNKLDKKLEQLDTKLDGLVLQQATTEAKTETKAQMSGAWISALTAVGTSTITGLLVWALTQN